MDGQQVLELNIKCFGWFLSPDQVKFIRGVDSRAPDYFALYAVEDETVQSQVGVVTLDTQSASGVEKVGYIWGVATRPSFARKGYAKKLMEKAHERLSAEGIRYSFLGTGKSLVAYHLYQKLGYKDLTLLKRGLKRCKAQEQGDISFNSKINNEIIVDLFSEYSKNLFGFIKRPKNFLEVRKAWSWMPYDLVGGFFEGETPIGYVVASTEGKVIKIRELCCPKIEDINKCITALESESRFEYMVLECVIGSYGISAFMESGFNLFDESWGVLMVKDLTQGNTIEEIRNSYGFEEMKFHMTSIDEY
ncbi:MAG: GNAT family N-acetyltransferase [Methanomassiliicoccales archaeon]|nr:MAG: GNAT family N-acetyltransferase [Methanomassiliicoccales archaeon]